MEIKKNNSVNYSLKRNLFMSIGLCISSLLVFSAFQIKTEIQPDKIIGHYSLDSEIFDETPITKHKEPQPPKPKPQPVLIDIVDDEIETPEIDIPDFEFEETDVIEDYESYDIPDEIVNDNTIVIAETQASFPGGMQAWGQFLNDNLKYPKMAKRAGIEGKVFLNFVVDKEGNISDIEIVRGIGAGCDDEAIRVLKMAPKWNPGLQRGNPVKSRMSLFIHFDLR